MISNTSKISVFAPPGAPGGAKTEIFQNGKKSFCVKKTFFLAIAAGHFEKNQQKPSKNQSDDAHICKIWRKYFIHILSIPKFGIVYAFSQRLKKLHLGRIS